MIEDLKKQLHDPPVFAKALFPDMVKQPFSKTLHSKFFEIMRRQPRFACIISPRGHAKTTINSIIGTLYDIAYNREDFVVVIHKTHKQATSTIENIRIQLEGNKEFNDIFGPFYLQTSRSDEIVVVNVETGHSTRILARGSLQDIRGFIAKNAARFTKVIGDDIESELNTQTAEQRSKNRRLLYAAVLPGIHPTKGKVWPIGTIVHNDSILARIKRGATAEESAWEVYFYQATKNGKLDGEPIWPERFPPEELKNIFKRYSEIGEEGLFWQEYMNIPYSPEERELADYGFFEGKLEGKYLTINGEKRIVTRFVGIDPSLGTAGGDYTGFVDLLVDQKGKRYVWNAWRRKLPPHVFVNWFFEMVEELKPDGVVLETVAQQEYLRSWLLDEMQYRDSWNIPLIRIDGINYAVSKQHRQAMTLAGPLRDRRLLINKRLMDSDLTGELDDYPKPQHDDITDALWLAYKGSYAPTEHTLRQIEERREKRFLPFKRKKMQTEMPEWIVL